MLKLIFVLLFLPYKIAFAEIKVNSIIKLNENVPEECGLNFIENNNEVFTTASISIKKLKNNKTITIFHINSENEIKSADLSTSSSKISEIINSENKSKSGFEFKGKTDQDLTTFFFQEILIGGGLLKIDDKIYEIKGPIDSKVRLEYLFCTGEMFLPNYESNQNE